MVKNAWAGLAFSTAEEHHQIQFPQPFVCYSYKQIIQTEDIKISERKHAEKCWFEMKGIKVSFLSIWRKLVWCIQGFRINEVGRRVIYIRKVTHFLFPILWKALVWSSPRDEEEGGEGSTLSFSIELMGRGGSAIVLPWWRSCRAYVCTCKTAELCSWRFRVQIDRCMNKWTLWLAENELEAWDREC